LECSNSKQHAQISGAASGTAANYAENTAIRCGNHTQQFIYKVTDAKGNVTSSSAIAESK